MLTRRASLSACAHSSILSALLCAVLCPLCAMPSASSRCVQASKTVSFETGHEEMIVRRTTQQHSRSRGQSAEQRSKRNGMRAQEALMRLVCSPAPFSLCAGPLTPLACTVGSRFAARCSARLLRQAFGDLFLRSFHPYLRRAFLRFSDFDLTDSRPRRPRVAGVLGSSEIRFNPRERLV